MLRSEGRMDFLGFVGFAPVGSLLSEFTKSGVISSPLRVEGALWLLIGVLITLSMFVHLFSCVSVELQPHIGCNSGPSQSISVQLRAGSSNIVIQTPSKWNAKYRLVLTLEFIQLFQVIAQAPAAIVRTCRAVANTCSPLSNNWRRVKEIKAI